METAAESREYRVVFFCPSTSGVGVDRLEAPVRRLLSRIQGPPAELAPLEAAGALSEAGWRVLLLRSLSEGCAAQALSAYVNEATCAMAAELEGDVLGLFLDVGGDSARICRCGPENGPETFVGRRGMAIGRAAEWLAVPAGSLRALFLLDPQDADYEPDEDDRFVEEKLREARELMERYRQRK
jgi:hypothetical protein